MGLIDKLRRVGGIVKNRLASAVGSLRGALGGVTVSGTKLRRGVRFAARGARLTSPVGIGLTAVSFAPEIARGVRAGVRAAPKIFARGVAFFGGRQVVSAAAAGGVAGVLGGRRSGRVSRPSDFGDPRLQSIPGRQITRTPRPRAKPRTTTTRAAPTRRKARARPTARRRRVSRVGPRKRKRRTHRSPRHKGHKRVSFTTKDGRKVSFLSNPKARHR